jgi:hypothetical protein
MPIKEENKGKICKNPQPARLMALDHQKTYLCICPYTATIEAIDVRTTSYKMPSDADYDGQVQELLLHLSTCW